jgi:hypothetical protein
MIKTIYYEIDSQEIIISEKIDVDKIEKHLKNNRQSVNVFKTTISFEQYCKDKKYFWIVKQELLQKIYDFTNEFLKNN